MIHEAGWMPFTPSPECRARLARPSFPDWLGEQDRIGIHAVLCYFEVVRRFPKLRATTAPDLVSALAAHLSVLGDDEFTRTDHASFRARLRRWYDQRFVPSVKRFTPELSSNALIEVKGLEPGWTFQTLWERRFPTDFEFNARSLEYAIRLGEQDGAVNIGHVNREPGISASDRDVEQLLDVVLGRGADRRLFYFHESGTVRLGAREAKRTLDTLVGGVAPVHEHRHDRLPEHEDVGDESLVEQDPAGAVESAESLEHLRQHLLELRSEVMDDTLEAAVLENFERLVDPHDDLSARGLCKRFSVSREKARRAVAKVREELVRRLSA